MVRLYPKYIEIQLPNGLKNIGNYAFYNYTNEALTELEIPASVTSIGDQALSISHLERLIMQSTTSPTIGASCVSAHAENLSIIYPCDEGAGASYVDAWGIEYYKYLTPAEPCGYEKPAYIVEGSCGDNATYSFNAATGILTISGTGAISDYNGTNMPWISFKDFITSVVVGDGITAIGNRNFYGHSNITSITLPASLESIALSAFSECSKLTSVTIPTNVTSIGQSAFSNCTALNSVTFATPASLTTIGQSAFAGCSSLEAVSIPASMETIGNYAFQNCSALNSLTFAASSELTSIGRNAFEGCSSLTSITIPATTDNLTIGRQAFYNLSGLTSVTFATPSKVSTIDQQAFASTGLTSITIPATPENLTIGSNAFNGCTNLASVNFAAPSRVTSFATGAFMSCSLTTITIPGSVTSMAPSVFRSCANLQEVIFEPESCPSGIKGTGTTATFYGTHSSLVLKCPDASGQGYANEIYTKSSDYWERLYLVTSGDHAPAPHAEGSCGAGGADNLHWETNGSTLTITGTGAMGEWDFMDPEIDNAPWFNYSRGITRIEIAEGVTTIGGSAFFGCDQVKTFVIPSTVTSIGADAFFDCDHPDVEVYCYADPDNLISWNDRNCDDFLRHGQGPRSRTFTWDERNAHLQETKCYVPSNYLAGYRERWNAGSTEWTGTDVNVFFAVGLNDANDADGINEILSNTDGERVPVLTLTRPLNRDGYFATICLPIDMDAAAIAKSALKDAQIREFTNAVMNAGTLEVEFSPVDHIEAGKPYFIKYTDEAMGEALDRLDFVDAVVNNVAPIEVTHGNLKMVGTYVPKAVEAQTDASGVLFLGANNTLFWPSKAGNIKPFRAYFELVGGGKVGAPKRGTPARIVERKNAPTGVDNATNNAQYTKRVENGQLVIERNGVRYNAAGQVVK